MAQTVIVQLTDDIDGGEADETGVFALNGPTYEIDLSANADKLRAALATFIEKARVSGRGMAAANRNTRNERLPERQSTVRILSWK
ncbi:MAG: histone-like nucleoid-structuring protein Lsr2 [Candidatus Dormibacteraceae bacterium]